MAAATRVPVPAEVLPDEVLGAWSFGAAHGERELGGLINRTFLVRAAGGEVIAVIQRLHPIFAAEVNVDIEAVTEHLAACGMVTPRLVRTTSGARWVEHEGAVWRALTYVDGATLHAVPDAAHAAAAGDLVGRFHRALASLRHDFVFRRASVHDTAAHLARLEQVLDQPAPPVHGVDTAETGDAVATAHGILEVARRLPRFEALPCRAMHGDLKISNVLFARATLPPSALCLIDLDTLGVQNIAYEMGDALRSWCNPAGEDTPDTDFDVARFAAALEGYAAGAAGLLGSDEIDAIVPGVETVCVELAARFCVDVFEDRYFGWNPDRFSSRRHHNLVRAQGQLALARAVARSRADALEALRRAFG